MKPLPDIPGKRTTLRDIANACGVSHSTVSRALKNSPLIAEETRKRIQQTAQTLHYAPDPMVSALANYRLRSKNRKQPARMALIIGAHLLEAWADLIDSAKSQANRLGFDFELYIWDPTVSDLRHSHILHSRGIRGLILAPLTEHNALEDPQIEWEKFSVVSLGNFLQQQHFNCVAPNHFETMRLSLAHLKKMGCKSPAFVTLNRINLRTRSQLAVAYHGQHSLFYPENIPICYLIENPVTPESLKQLRTWQERNQPDAWVSHRFMLDLAKKAGIEIGPNFQFIASDLLERQPSPESFTGVVHPNVEIGKQAVQLLANEITQGIYGAVAHPKSVYIDPSWREAEAKEL